MKQAYCLTMLLGCSLPMFAMENQPTQQATQELKAEMELKEITVEQQSLSFANDTVKNLVTALNLSHDKSASILVDDFNRIPETVLSEALKKAHFTNQELKQHEKLFVWEAIVKYQAKVHQTARINFRALSNFAIYGWGIAGLTTTALSIVALIMAINS